MSAPSTALGRSGNTENAVNLSDTHPVQTLIAMAVARVNSASDLYKPVYMSGALSGGHDSITACYIASLANGWRSMFHCNTGVGLDATEVFVGSLCLRLKWPLEVFYARGNVQASGKPDPMDYFAMVEKHGFPGPGQHGTMYIKLKERQIRRFVRAHKTKMRDRVMLVSGARRQESQRRTNEGQVEEHRREGAQVWCNPLFDFSKLDCARIMRYAELPRSPVVDLIHKSGECLCGCFRKDGELEETTLWFKDDPTIVRLNEAHARHKASGRHGWGERPMKRGCTIKKTGNMCTACDNARDEIARKATPLTLSS